MESAQNSAQEAATKGVLDPVQERDIQHLAMSIPFLIITNGLTRYR